MREEISAGGVVFKKSDQKLYFLLLKDQNGNWTFPKGLIEAGEGGQIAAAREISEETGIHGLKLFKQLSPIQYWYRWENDLIKKTVHYFLFQATGSETPEPQEEEGISEVRWFSPEETWEIVGYRKTNKKVLEEVFDVFKINLKN